MAMKTNTYFSSQNFIVVVFTLRPVIYFVVVWFMMWNRDLNIFILPLSRKLTSEFHTCKENALLLRYSHCSNFILSHIVCLAPFSEKDFLFPVDFLGILIQYPANFIEFIHISAASMIQSL